MKILKSLILFGVVILMFSCSKEENYYNSTIADNVNMELLEGAWTLSSAVDSNGNDQNEYCNIELKFTETSAILEYYEGANCDLTQTVIAPYLISGNIITFNVDGISMSLEIVQLTETVLRYKLTSSLIGSQYHVYVYSRSVENNPDSISESLDGTWKITSLTSNGTEKLQEILNGSNPPETTICYWNKVFSFADMTSQDVSFSGTDCTTETPGESLTYWINGTTLFYSTESFEIVELTATKLKLQKTYKESGKTVVDIYTYTRTGEGNNGGGNNGGGNTALLVGKWLLTSNVDNGVELVAAGDCPELETYTETTVSYKYAYGASCDMFEEGTYPYTKSGNTITVEGETGTILELSATTLKINFTYVSGGATVNDTYTYTRQ